MKTKDVYIGQKVGFTYNKEKFIGVVKSLNESIATIEFDDREDSEVNIKRLIGVCDDLAWLEVMQSA